MKVKNKNILITGGANGIGLSLTKMLSKNNQVFVLDLDTSVKRIKNTTFVQCDISNNTEVANAISKIRNFVKNIDILINNAAIQRVGEFTTCEFRDIINTNLCGTMQVTQESLKVMPEHSNIINILSIHAYLPRKRKISYDVSKAGLLMFTKELALELADKQITVNAISIGACDTPMNNDWINDENILKSVKSKIPLGKIESAEAIAKYILIILENFAENTTGSNFIIDQGRSITG
ncbi:MAG: SDR family oxidoreductase [Clostridia bacterium]|nr:SDR family oxidoreductase [Clostridia bacterium]